MVSPFADQIIEQCYSSNQDRRVWMPPEERKFLVNVALLIDIPALIAPDAPALLGAESLDFGGLRVAVAKGGGLLHDLGVGRGDRVGVISTNSVEYVQAMFAAALVGAVCVPMNYRAKRNEIAHLL